MDYDGDKGIDDASQASGLGDDVEPMGGKLGEGQGRQEGGKAGSGKKRQEKDVRGEGFEIQEVNN